MCGESCTHSWEGVVEGRPSMTTLQFSQVKPRVVGRIQRVSKILTPRIVSESWFKGWPEFPMAVHIRAIQREVIKQMRES